MIKTEHAQDYGRGLWYLPSVFENSVFEKLKAEYRETATNWEVSYPNRINSKYRNTDYTYLNEVAYAICPKIAKFVDYDIAPISQECFIDLPGHALTWHFDNNNFKILLQVYMGDTLMPNAGTQWYVGDENDRLWEEYGANNIVPVTGLPKIETQFAMNAGYINDNTKKKVHGTNRVVAGTFRESLLFSFG